MIVAPSTTTKSETAVVFALPFSMSDNPLIYVSKMHITDNPPAYTSNVPSSRSASTYLPPVTSPYLPPATVDQVHIFSRHDDIKGRLTTSSLRSSPYLCAGTYYIDPNVPSLRSFRHKCKRKSAQMLHASFRTRKGDISIDLGTTGDVYDVKKANVGVATHKGDIKINLVCA